MRILLAFFLIGTASLSLAQRSQELRSNYGEPDIERFTAAPDIGLTVEYGSDGQACQIVIERKQPLLHDKQAEKYMKPEVASKLIEEIAPPAIRGLEVNTLLESMGCAEGRHQEYENVWISRYSDVCVPLKPERESRATVVFKRQACPISPYGQFTSKTNFHSEVPNYLVRARFVLVNQDVSNFLDQQNG